MDSGVSANTDNHKGAALNRRQPSGRLGALLLIAFSAPSLALSFVGVPAASFLPNVYAKQTAISLAAIGGVLLVSRVFDAITDQLVGYWSDRTRGPLGPRKPWLIAGLPVMLISVAFLFNPGPDAGILYFGAWSLLYYFGYTLIYVPHLAWASELSPDYTERSRIFTFYSVTGQVGQFLIFGAPIVLHWASVLDSSEMDAGYMRVLIWCFFAVFPIVIAIALWFAPQGERKPAAPIDFRTAFLSLARNQLLRRYMSIFLLYGVSAGMFTALIIVYFDSYMGIAELFSYALIAMVAVSILSLYPWMKLVKRFGKHRPWAWSWLGSILTTPLLILFPPGHASFLPVLAIFLLYAAWESVSNVVSQSILADLVDYDALITGSDKAGSFYALQGLMVKMAYAVGAGLAFILLDIFHYSIQAPETNDAASKAGFMVAFLILPSLLKAGAVALVWNYPLDKRRHDIVRKRLDQRTAAAEEAG